MPTISRPQQPQRRSLRIGLLTPTLYFGGAERWIITLARGLHTLGHRITGIGLRDPGATTDLVTKTIPIGIELYDGQRHFHDLANRSDVLIVWGISDLSDVTETPAKIVLVAHGHCDWSVDLMRRAAPFAHHYVAVSRHAAESFPPSKDVTILHNGIDHDRCEPTLTRAEQRTAWGIEPQELLIGYVGRISPEKNPISAALAARALGKPYRPVYVGAGPMTSAILDLIRPYVPNLLHFPPVHNVGNVYHALDCLMLTSAHEGFSLALAEAWYCGLPTVSTPVGATELQEAHGRLSVNVNNPLDGRELARAVSYALSRHNVPTVLHAQEVVRRHYLDHHFAQRWDDYLHAILPPNAPRRV